MPNSIDNKIVEMQFDNKNFEKNVAQSIKSLEDLNKALELDKATKGFENMEKAADSIDLTKLMNAAEVIEKRFSAAGIAGAALIQRGVNGAINLVTKLGSSIVNLAKTGGINRALKLEHANFMLEGILKNADMVEKIMNGPVNKAVSGTAYGLDSAANAAAQFVAAGVTNLEKLETALTGISGVAAMSGASYDEIARIFTKVASRGKVMGDTIQELSTRGIAAQEELAKYLKITTAEVEDLRKKGQISFEDFANAMNDAFGEQAKKANETFTGAMSNVKAALSRIGAKVATPTIEELRKVLVMLIDVVNKVNTVLSAKFIPNINEVISRISFLTRKALDSKSFMTFIEKTVNNLSDSFELLLSYLRPIRNAFKEVFPGSVFSRLNNFNDGLSALIQKVQMTGEKAAGLQYTMQGIFAALDIVLTIAKQIFGILLPGVSGVYDATDTLGTKILKLTGFIGFLLTKLDNWLKQNNIFTVALNKLNEALGITEKRTITISDVIIFAIKAVGEAIKGVLTVFGLIVGGIVTFANAIYSLPAVQMIINDLKGAIVDLGERALPILGGLAAAFVDLLDSVIQFGEGGYLTGGLEKLNDVLNNVYWGIKNVFGAVGSFFGLFKKGDSVLTKLDNFAVANEKVANSLEAVAGESNDFVNEMGVATETITKTADTFMASAESANKVLVTTGTVTKQTSESIDGAVTTFEKAGKIFALGFGASVISAGVNIGRAFGEIARVSRNLKGITKSMKLFFEQLQLNLRIKTLLAFAACIVVLAGALALLTKLDPVRLLAAAAAMGIITVAMMGIARAMSKAGDGRIYVKFLEASGGMLNLSLALLALAAAVRILSDSIGSWKQFVSMLGGVVIILLLMAGVCTALTLVGNLQKGAIKGAGSMIIIAGAIYIMMASLERIQNLDLDKIQKSIPLLLQIIGGLVGISLALSLTLSPLGGLSFLGMVAGVIALLEGLSLLQSVDYKVIAQAEAIIETIVLGIQHIIGWLVLLQALNAAEAMFYWLPTIGQKITRGIRGMFAQAQKGIRYIGVAALIIAIAAAIKLIGDTLIALSALSVEQMAKGGAAVIALSMVVAYVTTKVIEMASQVLAAGASAKSLGIGFAGIGASILMAALSIKLLSDTGKEFYNGGLKVALIMGALLGFLVALGKFVKFNSEIKVGIAVFGGIAALFGAMVAAIVILALLPWEVYIPAVASVVAIMAVLGGVVAAIGKLSTLTPSAAVAVVGLAGIFLSLGYIMKLLEKVVTANVFVNLVVLEGAVAIMATIMGVIGKYAEYVDQGLAVVASIAVIMGGLAVVGKVVESIDTATMEANLIALGKAMAALLGVISIIAILSAATGGSADLAIEAGIIAIKQLAASMVVMSLAAVPFGIGAALVGQGVKDIADGFARLKQVPLSEIVNTLGNFAITATKLGLAAKPLVEFAKSLDQAILPIESLGSAAKTMTEGLNSITTIDVDTITTKFTELAQALQFVCDKIFLFGEFAAIAAAVGAATMILGTGLSMTSVGLIGVGFAIDEVCLGIAILSGAVSSISNIIITVTNSIRDMARELKNMGASTISEIIEALYTYGANQLGPAGQTLFSYVKAGWDEAVIDFAPEMITQIISGLGTQVSMRETEIYGIGWRMAEMFKLGMLESFEIQSPSRVAMENVDYIVAGYEVGTDDNAGNMENAGKVLADSYVRGLTETSKDAGKDLVKDTVDTLWNDSIASEQTAYDSGEVIGSAFDQGARDPSESYCENKTGREIIDDTVDTMNSQAGARSGDSYNAGTKTTEPFGKGAFATLTSWFTKAKEEISKFIKDPTNYFASKVSNVTDKLINDPTSGIQKALDEYGKSYSRLSTQGSKYFRSTFMTGIGMVNWKGEVVDPINKTTDSVKNLSDAMEGETGSLDKNSKATGGSTKAKKENKKANDKKTKAINEESEALEEETEEVEDNEEAIREQAEAIEIVTEKFKDYLNTYKYSDSFKNATRLNKAFSKLWSAEDKSLKDVNKTYDKVSESLSNSLKKINKQVLEFDSSGKYLGKFTKSLNVNLDSIQKRAVKIGRTILKAKVMGSATKIFYKVGNAIETMTITTTKNLKKLGKHFLAAKEFIASFNAEIEHQESSEEFIKNLRGIETYFGATKLGKMEEKAKSYLKGIANEFEELSDSMNILGKNIDGVGNILSKNSKSTAFVEDAFLSLAATLYDGTDAANEYATEHAKLLFLMENGLATQEEVDEHFQSYISRLKDTLLEYRNTIYENLAGSMDIWSEFNQNLMEEGTDLIHNIESQIAGYMNWSNMLMELSKRGFDSGIIKMLTDEGVSSFGKAKALMEMTGNELALFTVRYQQSQAVIETATDTALAAVANAQTRASLRAAAAQGDKTAQKQLQQSKKTKKELLDDARAVADYQAKYRKLNDKEEKKYLKSLTKDERKAYKEQLKAAKKQQKELEKAAKAEEAKRAEEDRIATIRTSIKTFEDYIHTINKYSKDSSVMAAITEDITKAFEPLNDTIAEFTDMTREDAINALLGFAESLDSTGNTANDYFTEMTERLTKYISTIKDAIKNQISFTQAIKTSSNGYTGNDFVRNLTTNLTAASQINSYVEQLANKFGTNNINNILIDIGKKMLNGANIGDILEILNTYLGMTSNQIMAINYGLMITEKEAETVANKLTAGVTTAVMDSNAISRYEKATDALATYSNKLSETRDELERTKNEYESSMKSLSEAEANMANASVAITKLEKKKKEGTITKKEKLKLQEYKAILKRYQDEVSSLQATVNQNKSAMENAQNAFNDASSSYNAALKEYTEAEKAYNRAVKEYNDSKLTAEQNRARQEAELRLEQQAYQILNTISCYNDLINVEKTQTKQSRIMQKVTAGMKDVVKAVAGSIDEYGRRWKNVSNLSQMVNKDTEDITRAFLRLSDTLSSSGDLSSDYFTNAAAKLSEYRDTLYDTIKGQVSLFESFDRYSGDKATSASTYLDNMNSQLTGLEEWLTGLETLSQRGVSGDLLQIFAAEGQNSYEKVMAFANATDEQLGELVSKYREYQKLTEEAADRALAAVGASYTDAAMSATEALIKAFQTNGATRLEETAYNAGMMIITGVKEGLGNSMPEIISATEDTAEAVSTTVSTKIGESVGKSINEGVVQSVANSVESTVNAAIEKFKMAVDAVNSYVQETLQSEFTITVHVNTSEIDAAVARMNQAVYGINTQAVETQDAYVSARQASIPTVDITPTEPAPTQDVNVTYVQNNYSPKSLSRTEIYRQTRNQLSTIEGVVQSATGG